MGKPTGIDVSQYEDRAAYMRAYRAVNWVTIPATRIRGCAMHQSKPRPHRPPTTMPTRRSAHDAELVDSMTDLLDEIDNILEENVVRHVFRQRGGQ